MASWYTEEKKREELRKVTDAFDQLKEYICSEEIERYEVKVVLRDGVSLRTFVTRPKGLSSVPTIFQRTCYPEGDFLLQATADEYARRGFAYVYQFCRGTGGSEGEWVPNIHERDDGKDSVDWLSREPWVASIGYQGCSYTALTGWTIADIVPEKVKTMYLTHYGLFRHVSAYQDGLFRHDILTGWAMWNAGFEVTADYLESCRFRPQIEVDEKLWGHRIDWYREWITNTDSDDPYWNTGFWGMLKEIPKRVRIPIFFGEGWYDHHLGSSIETYKVLGEESRKQSTFLIGPWDHNFNIVTHAFEGNDCDNDEVIRAFRWFHELLVEGRVPKANIRTYVCGDDRWIDREEYAVSDGDEYRLSLSADSSLKEDADRGSLTYLYDPEDPVPSHGAESLMVTSQEQGSLKQYEPGFRSDVLTFLSKELKEDKTVLGSISVHLRVSTDAEDTAFAVKVSEVLPNGDTYNIRSGITTLGYRDKLGTRQEYTPDEICECEVRMWDICWKLHKGSRIRVDVYSSDFPQYSIHSNYAGCWALADKTKVAKQTVYTGKDVSYISIPVVGR